jgi:deazaflavin-dependent oxidoreductase (nitroreductase family)
MSSYADFKRWMYRGARPHRLARLLNSVYAALASSGVTSNYLVNLEVIGRKSGQAVVLPVVLTVVDGQRYLVSMLGENAQWVLNVHAAHGKAALLSSTREEVQLEEVPTDQRAPILKAYLKRAPGARPHIPVSKDARLEEFGKIAKGFPVFRIASHES